MNQRHLRPQLVRTDRPGLAPLFRARQAIPVNSPLARRDFGFVEENRVKDPAQQNDANQDPPPYLPCSLHSLPQRDLMCAIPAFTSSRLSDGLNSKTFECSGFTKGLSSPNLIVPVPGARWSRPGNSTS